MTAEDRQCVRERLAEVLLRLSYPGADLLDNDDESTLARQTADAILADTDLLDDLCRERMEQVGQIERGPCGPIVRLGSPPVPSFEDGIDIYRFRGRTDG